MRYYLVLLVHLLVVINITSWSCGNSSKKEQIKIRGKGREESKEEGKEANTGKDKAELKAGGLIMSLTKTDLVGDAKETEAIFSLAKGDEIAGLTKFNVRITVTEIGGSGSSINYTDSKKTSRSIIQSLQESIVHFFPITELASYKNPLKVLFTLVPGPKVSLLNLRFELLDTQNKILKEENVSWKPKPAGIKLKLTPLGSTNLSSGNRLIRFKIEREPGSEDVDSAKLQLMINEESDSNAKVTYKGREVTVLSGLELGAMGDEITFVIQPSKVMAVFAFQIIYNGNKIGKSERFIWTELIDDPSQQFLSAIITGDIIKIKQLLFLYGPNSVRPSIDINTTTSYTVRTPLHFVVEKNNQAIIEMVLGVPGIDVNKQSMEGFTPLHIAVIKENQVAIQLLLNKGADVNVATFQGKTPLHLAVERGNQPIIEKLLRAKAIKVNAQTVEGKTPLHLAVELGNQPIIEKLLSVKKINIELKDNSGNTPLYRAFQKKNKSAIEALKAKKVQLQRKSR